MGSARLLLVALALSASLSQPTGASLNQLVWKRQAEQEASVATSPATPAAAAAANQNQAPPASENKPERLYPDLPRQPTQFVPPFNGQPALAGPPFPAHHGPTPFSPFGIQIPPNRLNADQQPAPFGRGPPAPKLQSAAERLRSQSFADGLGRRLLAMVGIDTSAKPKAEDNNQGSSSTGATSPPFAAAGHDGETARALQNVTILQQLNKGVNSVYGSLSRMYNSTVQEQLGLLQDRLAMMAQNNSNPWAERAAQQVPQFFREMATKLADAQEHLNRVWRDASNGTLLASRARAQPDQARPGWFGGNAGVPFLDQLSSDVGGMFQQGGFFDQMGRSVGLGGSDAGGDAGGGGDGQQQQQPARDLGAQMREFWFSQIQPQIGMVRGQLARVWRELTASGAMAAEPQLRSRNNNNNNQGSSNGNLLDNLIKEVETSSNSEYALIEGGEANAEQNKTTPKLSLQMQNGLINVQRELNQLWRGLTNSIQGTLSNAKSLMNPSSRFGPAEPTVAAAASQQQPAAADDPAGRDLNGKLGDLSKLQRDADLVHEAIQQQQREQQQRQMFGDKFRNFFNNFDLANVEQFPNRIGDTVSRFGTVMGNLWNQIPERWDNFVANVRPSPAPEFNARLAATSSTPAPAAAGAAKPEPEK